SGVALFVRDDHLLAGKQEIDTKVLADLPCIQLNQESPGWLAISRELIAADIRPGIEHRVALLTTVFGMIQAGMGVAVLPRLAALQMPAEIRFVPLRNPMLSWPISLMRLANVPLSPAAREFSNIARAVIKQITKKPQFIT